MAVRRRDGGEMQSTANSRQSTVIKRFLSTDDCVLATERGQAYVELVMVLPLFLMVIAALIFFGRVLYVKIALDMASYDACRAAVEALQPDAGISQGLIAGRETLRGFYLNAAGANLAISPAGGWARGVPVQCTASYDLFAGDIPSLSAFANGSGVVLQSTTWSRVELWRSVWQ